MNKVFVLFLAVSLEMLLPCGNKLVAPTFNEGQKLDGNNCQAKYIPFLPSKLEDGWFTPGRHHKPATGFLAERLRNVRKRIRSGKRGAAAQVPQNPLRIIPGAVRCLALEFQSS